jgi:hypothetical protein
LEIVGRVGEVCLYHSKFKLYHSFKNPCHSLSKSAITLRKRSRPHGQMSRPLAKGKPKKQAEIKPKGKTQAAGRHSAGCQVFESADNFSLFMGL